MLNLFDIPKPQNGFVSVFPGFARSLLQEQWVTWEKPAGITMISIICIGGGAGGGSGFPSASTSARGGGGGGSSGNFTTVQIAANLLPDILYVQPGAGGPGGASSTTAAFTGNNGGLSCVSIAPSSALIYVVCLAFGGTAGSTAASATVFGSAGNGNPAFTIANGGLLAGLGRFSALSASPGTSGGNVASGNASGLTYPTTGLLLTGGAGGGGNFSAGGSISAPASQSAVLNLFPSIPSGTAGNPGTDGGHGHERVAPLMSTGGAGGGANSGAVGAGGRGGNGGFGSGGGGGGAGGSTGGGGAGGNGGPGLVLIYSW